MSVPAVDEKFWLDCPVYVTGATGLFGSWLVKRCIAACSDVVCLVRNWVSQSKFVARDVIAKVRVVRGDVCNQALAERILGEYEVKTVIHLAAQTIVGVANRNLQATFETNIAGTCAMLDACRRSPKASEIVVASSDQAYGDQAVLPHCETTSLDGRHPHKSKSCADLIALTYGKSYRPPLAITRCVNFYGGGDLNWNRIVSGTIRSLLRGERPVIRSDGQFAEKLSAHPEIRGEAFNLSNEIKVDVRSLVNKLRHIIGVDLAPIIQNEASDEMSRQYLSAENVHRLLTSQPQFTPDAALAQTVNWYKKYLGIHGI